MSENMIIETIAETEEERALKAFLLDSDCINLINPWISKFNLFDVLKISRTEIRHSNMLGWLFDPNESHGLNDLFIRGIMQRLIRNYSNPRINIFKILLMDFHSFIVLREWKNIDLLLVSNEEKFVLCIENKIGSIEHDNQLVRYKKIIDSEYKDYLNMLIYLTPNGDESSDIDNWQTLSYVDIIEVLESCMSMVEVLPDIKLLIENYIDVVRRDIVGDEKLIKICNEIYNKHKKALNLIYENIEDIPSQFYVEIKKWCSIKAKEGKINFDESKSSKTRIRFTTDNMTNLLGELEEANSGWKSTSYYYYEVQNRNGWIRVQLCLLSQGLNKEQEEKCMKLGKIAKAGDFKENWTWKTIKALKWQDLSNLSSEVIEESIFELLDGYLIEINKFEDKIIGQWSED